MKSTQAFGLRRSASTTGWHSSWQSVGLEDVGDFLGFRVRDRLDFSFFAQQFLFVVLCVAARRQKAAKAHRDRACRDFGESRYHHEVRRRDGARRSGRQRKGNSQPVGHADYNVADQFTSGEMRFRMRSLRHWCPPCAAGGSTVRRSAAPEF